jgi:hypothetical protein
VSPYEKYQVAQKEFEARHPELECPDIRDITLEMLKSGRKEWLAIAETDAKYTAAWKEYLTSKMEE